ncbi:RNA-dependent RNA polymerase [Wuhan spider virus 7]|uniref:RNA-dependent RNA polymerase n=1 Tax=Wuhan spider virus 7 TaxID=1923756 RepID=UPI00090BFCA4|nr:RNA-dependent RNA polymerase [Wuhan spider virus 7]APG77182.1 RNA-dependent RNA polymerase [Wuhan spider virus 7]
MNESLFAKRIEEVEKSILNLADWVGQSHKRPAGSTGLERRISEIFGCPYHGPVMVLSLPDRLLEDFREESFDFQSLQNRMTSTELYIEAVTHRFIHAWTLAKTMTLAYWDILELYGFEISDTWRCYRELSSRIFSFGILNLGEAYLKHQTAFLLARCLENEPPPRPSWFPWCEREGYLLGGPVMRRLWCRLVLRRHKRDISLAYSLYQAKKVAPEISPLLVNEAMQKNLDLLTSEREDDDVEDLKYQVRRTVREISKITGPGLSFKTSPFPSLSACFERPRSKGGALEELLPRDGSKILAFKELLGYVIHRTQQLPIYGIPYDEDRITFPFPIHRNGESGYTRLHKDLMVRRQAITEPFKVRVVSMGSAEHYQALKGLQSELWGFLRKSPVFDLTGRPSEEGDVASICRWVGEFVPNHYVMMVSGDYSSATDNLHPELSEACFDELCNVLDIPWPIRSLGFQGLTRHTIVDDDGSVHRQCWGQLMGSPISFPILCLVNCAVTRFQMEKEFGLFIPLSYPDPSFSPLKINGDDILFPLPPGGYQNWCETVTRAGLAPSVGKNYVSRRVAVINSELYDLSPDWDRGHEEVTRIPYINLGLLKYVQDHGRGDEAQAFVEDNFVSTMRERLITATRGWDNDTADRLVSYCLRSNHGLLSRIPPVSWWVAEEYGGLGLPSFREVEIAEHHLKLAAAFLMVDQRLIWSMRHPRSVCQLTTFSQETERYIGQIYDQLEIPWMVINPEMEDDCCKPAEIYVPQILRGYTCLGAGRELTGDGFLKRWAYVYNRWMKILRRNWLVFKPMNKKKSLERTGRFWIQAIPKASYHLHHNHSGPIKPSEIQDVDISLS